MTGWRTHLHHGDVNKFDYCQDQPCPNQHFITTFKGSRLAADSWEGMLDSDGKVPK